MSDKENVAVSALRGVLNAVQMLAPIAKKLGGPTVASVATIALAASATAENMLDRAGEGSRVLSSDDKVEISQIISSLAAVNDQLAKAVSES